MTSGCGWNDEWLRVELEALKVGEFDLDLTGFSGKELDKLLADSRDDSSSPQVERPLIHGASLDSLAPSEEERAELEGCKLIVEYSGGKDSTAAAIWAQYFFPENEIELMFVDLGADFVGFHLHLHQTANKLGLPLVTLRSPQTVVDNMLEKGEWPGFLYPYCHQLLHAPMDAYLKQLDPQTTIVLRGGRLAERAAKGKRNVTRFLVVDRMKDYRYFQPLYFGAKDSSESILAEAGMVAWEGYQCGLQRTACRICPGQRPIAYAAIRAHYPEVWRELMHLEGKLGKGAWHQRDKETGGKSFVELADKGEAQFLEGNYQKPGELPIVN